MEKEGSKANLENPSSAAVKPSKNLCLGCTDFGGGGDHIKLCVDFCLCAFVAQCDAEIIANAKGVEKVAFEFSSAHFTALFPWQLSSRSLRDKPSARASFSTICVTPL